MTIHIRNIQTARAFYREVLGLQEIRFDEQAARCIFAVPGTPTVLSMHVMTQGEVGREPGTVSGLIFTHHNVPWACDEIRRRGGRIFQESIHVAATNQMGSVIADPDGNEFVLSGPPS